MQQVAAKRVWPTLPASHSSINEVWEDQAAVEAPLLKDLVELKAKTPSRGLPRCSSAATQATTPTGNTLSRRR